MGNVTGSMCIFPLVSVWGWSDRDNVRCRTADNAILSDVAGSIVKLETQPAADGSAFYVEPKINVFGVSFNGVKSKIKKITNKSSALQATLALKLVEQNAKTHLLLVGHRVRTSGHSYTALEQAGIRTIRICVSVCQLLETTRMRHFLFFLFW